MIAHPWVFPQNPVTRLDSDPVSEFNPSLLQEPDRVGQTNNGIISNVTDLHPHKLEASREVALKSLSIRNGSVEEVALVRDKASLLVIHTLNGQESLSATGGSVNLVTDLGNGVLHVDVERHGLSRTLDNISAGILDSSDDGRLLAAARVDDSGGNTV